MNNATNSDTFNFNDGWLQTILKLIHYFIEGDTENNYEQKYKAVKNIRALVIIKESPNDEKIKKLVMESRTLLRQRVRRGEYSVFVNTNVQTKLNDNLDDAYELLLGKLDLGDMIRFKTSDPAQALSELE